MSAVATEEKAYTPLLVLRDLLQHARCPEVAL
jgi:hypothetical protein